MTVTVLCPACRTALACPEQANGKQLRCGKCQHVFQAAWPVAAKPAPPPAADPIASLPEALPVERFPDALPVERLLDALPVVQQNRSARPTPQRAVAPPAPSRAAKDPSDVLWWKCNRTGGVHVQAGVVVLRKKFVVFIPSEESRNVLAQVVGGVANAASPIKVYKLPSFGGPQGRRDRDLGRMVDQLRQERPDDFDEALIETAKYYGGFVWPQDQVKVGRATKKKDGRPQPLMFSKDTESLRGYATAGPMLDRLLEGWTITDPPILADVIGLVGFSALPLFMATATYLCHLWKPNEVPYWAAFIWLGFAVPLYLAAGFIVARAQLRRYRNARQAAQPRAVDPPASK
jgi:hypothetical protein